MNDGNPYRHGTTHSEVDSTTAGQCAFCVKAQAWEVGHAAGRLEERVRIIEVIGNTANHAKTKAEFDTLMQIKEYIEQRAHLKAGGAAK